MTIAQLIQAAYYGRYGRSHAWRTCPGPMGAGFELWHYATRMAIVHRGPSGAVLFDWGTGRGSVSDQNGMNTLFRSLGIPARFDRAGGARVTFLS